MSQGHFKEVTHVKAYSSVQAYSIIYWSTFRAKCVNNVWNMRVISAQNDLLKDESFGQEHLQLLSKVKSYVAYHSVLGCLYLLIYRNTFSLTPPTAQGSGRTCRRMSMTALITYGVYTCIILCMCVCVYWHPEWQSMKALGRSETTPTWGVRAWCVYFCSPMIILTG